MGGARRPAVAWSVAAASCAMFVAFAAIYLSPLTPRAVFQEAGELSSVFFVLPYGLLALLGALIAARRPDNNVGWFVLWGAAAIGVGALCDLFGSLLVHAHNAAGPWVALGGVLWAGGISPSTAFFVAALLRFPDGRLRSVRWRWVVLATVILAAATCVLGPLNPARGAFGIGYTADPSVNAASPIGVGAVAGIANGYAAVSTYAAYAVEALALLAVFLRLRGADSELRHQIKWFAAGAVTTIVCTTIPNFLPTAGNPTPLLLVIISSLALLGGIALPGGAAVAILKYRLYDIDVVISRALVYGSLAACITAVYVGIAVGFGALAGGGGKPNLGLSILATAMVAVGFQPVRARLQRVANRLVYGKRASPYEALSQFSQRAGESYTLQDVLPRMARLLAEGTGAELATVWLRSGSALRAMATWPVEAPHGTVSLNGTAELAIPDAARTAAVLDQQSVLGALSVSKRRGESLSPIEAKLMDDLAHQAGLVMKNASLTTDLQARMEELRASRQRLVAAQDGERRRLERDLHDGAQQHLVALKVKIGLAETLADRDPEKARSMLQQLRGDADEALQTLRELAHGIYPPLLADKGLAAALEAHSRRATMPVTVDADGLGRFTQDVEAAVYFCCLEALQNAQKYADAGEARIVLRDSDGTLRFDVADNGRGFNVTKTKLGSGLVNMRDRLEALGGSLSIESMVAHGTRVIGIVPTGNA